MNSVSRTPIALGLSDATGARAAKRARRRSSVAWAAIVVFGAFPIGALWSGSAAAVKLGYTPLALLTGVFLLHQAPPLYLGFTLWLWFLSPLVRRLVDYQLGFTETNPILLAPLLVTALSLLGLLQGAPRLRRRAALPFALAFLGVVYGYFVGLFAAGIMAASYGLVVWAAPIWLGCFLALSPSRYPTYRQVCERSFVWGMLIVGLYGVLQFLAPPAWDRYWMISSEMATVGLPQPYAVRVFATLNSPGPCAGVLMVGLLILAGTRHSTRWLSAIAGAAALLLSLVRAAWGGLSVGLLTLALYSTGKLRRRLLVMAVIAAVVLIPLLGLDRFSAPVMKRMESFSSLEDDVSLRERRGFYRAIWNAVSENPLGQGVGSSGRATVLTGGRGLHTVESGWLDVLYSLGWWGGALYLTGLGLVFTRMIRRIRIPGDAFVDQPRAVIVAILALATFGNIFTGVMGALLWCFLGLHVAAQEHARTLRAEHAAPRRTS